MLLGFLRIVFAVVRVAAFIIVIALVWQFLRSIICVLRKRPPYFPCGGIGRHLEIVIKRIFADGKPLANALLCIVLIYGAFSFGSSLGESRAIQYWGIGSEYEAHEVTYSYDAMLYTYSGDLTYIESYLPCIATIYRSDLNEYIVEKVELPYGITFEPDAFIENDYRQLEFGEHYGINLGRCYAELIIISPTTFASNEALRHSSPQYATFLASKKGDTIHFSDCAYLERIQRSNIIHFSNEVEAELYGYEICTKCYDKHLK